VGTLLDQQGIAVRTGHHCTMPLMDQFKIPGTVRASFTFYNTLEEVDALFKAIEKVKMFLL
jgi:cysteine desulfurase/selenocysteine lyase